MRAEIESKQISTTGWKLESKACSYTEINYK